MAKIITYNVNGIRSAISKGFIEWMKAANPDVICLQEIKADPTQFDTKVFEEMGYYHYWYSAQKKGYSGVAILTKLLPSHVEYGCGMEI
jgi:exodeoxyribonuclease III